MKGGIQINGLFVRSQSCFPIPGIIKPVTLIIFLRHQPVQCFCIALTFGIEAAGLPEGIRCRPGAAGLGERQPQPEVRAGKARELADNLFVL